MFENRPMLVYLLKFFISQNVILTSDNTVWQARSMKKLCQLLPKIKFTICYDKFFMCFLNLNANFVIFLKFVCFFKDFFSVIITLSCKTF